MSPPYAVYGGGRILKYRFNQNIIEKMVMFNYSALTDTDIATSAKVFYMPPEDFIKTDFYNEHLRGE